MERGEGGVKEARHLVLRCPRPHHNRYHEHPPHATETGERDERGERGEQGGERGRGGAMRAVRARRMGRGWRVSGEGINVIHTAHRQYRI